MNKKEQLQKQLSAILQKEEIEMIKKHYPKICKKYKGKYFKSPNSYDNKSSWMVYTKVQEITPDDVYDTRGNGVTSYFKGFNFQHTSQNESIVRREITGFVHSLGTEITEKEFKAAWAMFLKRFNNL